MILVRCARPRTRRIVLSLLAVITMAGGARAEPPARLRLSTSSPCPAAPPIAAQLRRVLPETVVSEQVTGDSSTVSAEIFDQGTRFVVRVAGQRRRFDDVERDCAERARLAAVFIGIVLDPPQTVSLDQEPARLEPEDPKLEAAGPERQSAPDDLSPLPQSPSSDLEIGALLKVAPVADAVRLPVAAGASGRFLWGRTIRLSVGVHALLPSTLRFASADARVTWLGGDIGARFVHRAVDFELAGELGPSLMYVFATGERVERPTTEGRLEVGARAAILGRFWASPSLGVFAGVSSTVVPQPSSLEVSPDGRFGQTPTLWFGATIGLMTAL